MKKLEGQRSFFNRNTHYSQKLETSLYMKLVEFMGKWFCKKSHLCGESFSARNTSRRMSLSQAQAFHLELFGFPNILTALEEPGQGVGAWKDGTEGLIPGRQSKTGVNTDKRLTSWPALLPPPRSPRADRRYLQALRASSCQDNLWGGMDMTTRGTNAAMCLVYIQPVTR